MFARAVLCLAGASFVVSCNSDSAAPSQADAAGPCTAMVPDESCPKPTPAYATDVVPIFEAKCNTCHDGKDGGPWPLTDHADVVHWRTQVFSVLVDCTMPPPKGTGDLTSSERQTLINWLACGAPDN
jgi:cytochrome c5